VDPAWLTSHALLYYNAISINKKAPAEFRLAKSLSREQNIHREKASSPCLQHSKFTRPGAAGTSCS
jgi:hypothetical protein